ncbi:MAG: radical SAM family heme chaperone HemW [Gemmatimonadaceae bacterium]
MLAERRHRAAVSELAVRHLYIHVPFCARRCSYCDFAITVRAATPVTQFNAALELELAMLDTSTWNLDTVYMGGGTPSRLGPAIGDVLGMVRDRAPVAPDAEVTIEANPDDVTPANASAWFSAGINRVSLGAQTFDSSSLEWMHRTHTSEQIGAAVHVLRDAGIANISLDLIFALPETLGRKWNVDLDRALALGPDHISLYGLTVEPHTPLGKWRDRGEAVEAPEERYESEFLIAHERLGDAGFEHYEVSNFALPGRRARHNSAYWRGVPYAAIGPSAHAFDGSVRSWNVAAYPEWERRLHTGEPVVAGSERLSEENRLSERVYLGLRTTDGLRATDAELELVRPWVDAGWATVTNRTIVLTISGFLRLDALAASLTLAGSH